METVDKIQRRPSVENITNIMQRASITHSKEFGTRPVLAMSLLVRDEVRLIRPNVEFHHRMGVDCFIIMDNGSVDGTREAIEDLGKVYPVKLIDEPSHTMRQDEWVTRMAVAARTEWGADWIINGDADEFWVPSSGSLKAEVPSSAGVLLCERSNMLADRATLESSEYDFYRHHLRVSRLQKCSDGLRYEPAELSDEPVILSGVRKKVMCRLDGLRRVGYGNHDAVHDGPVRQSTGIHIYHYPVRTFDEFQKKVVNHGTSLENNPGLPRDIGWHVRRWYSLYRQGLLRDEYDRLVLDEARASSYVESGVIEPDFTLWRHLDPSSAPGESG
jgi:glycosyl transferase family 2